MNSGSKQVWTNREEDEFSENFDETLVPVPEKGREMGKKAKVFDKNGKPIEPGQKGVKMYDKQGNEISQSQLFDKNGNPISADSPEPKFDALGNPIRVMSRMDLLNDPSVSSLSQKELEKLKKSRPKKGRPALLYDKNGKAIPPGSKSERFDQNGRLIPKDQLYDELGRPVDKSFRGPKFDEFGNLIDERHPQCFDEAGFPVDPDERLELGKAGMKFFDQKGNELPKSKDGKPRPLKYDMHGTPKPTQFDSRGNPLLAGAQQSGASQLNGSRIDYSAAKTEEELEALNIK
jgi:hypothetical protein